jgi:hypothetical protein
MTRRFKPLGSTIGLGSADKDTGRSSAISNDGASSTSFQIGTPVQWRRGLGRTLTSALSLAIVAVVMDRPSEMARPTLSKVPIAGA